MKYINGDTYRNIKIIFFLPRIFQSPSHKQNLMTKANKVHDYIWHFAVMSDSCCPIYIYFFPARDSQIVIDKTGMEMKCRWVGSICWRQSLFLLWGKLRQPLCCSHPSAFTVGHLQHTDPLLHKHLVPLISEGSHMLPWLLKTAVQDTWDLHSSDPVLWGAFIWFMCL